MAAIEKRGDGWRVRWRDPDGRPRSQQAPDERTARQIATDIERRVAQGLTGHAPQQDPLEAEDAVAAYLDHRAAMGSPRTAKTYEVPLTRFVLFARKGRRSFYLADMSHDLVERWFVELVKEGSPAHNTRIQYTRIVARWWAWCARRYQQRVAHFVAPELPRKIRHKQVAPTWEEMDRCVEAAIAGAATSRSPRDRDWVARMAMIMRFTGLRVRQTSLLTWEDFDLDRGLLHVPAETEKTRVGRVVPVSGELVAYLAGLGVREGGLFARAWVPEAKWINRCWRAAGVRKEVHGWHSFRRGFETGLLALNVDLVRVRALVGHSSGVDDSYIDAAGLDLASAVARIPPVRARSVLDLRRSGS